MGLRAGLEIRMPNARGLISLSLITGLFLISSGCGDGTSKTDTVFKQDDMCPLGEAVETEGYRRLALIVGVGQYKNESVPDLAGPPNDARRFYDLLAGRNGYAFPKQNVCLLLDEQATTARFKEAFAKALVERAQQGDVAVFFYAGHGSRTRDSNGDEPDEWDETFMFHDARTGKIHDLLDDEFNGMLVRLHKKTKNITVVLDSCNSGTATRGDAGTFVARYVEPADDKAGVVGVGHDGDGATGWVPETMPGLVVFAAAGDGTPALETAGRGVFSDAILQVFSNAADRPLTYAQAARQIPPLVAAASYQIPYFQGDLSRPVFGNTGRTRPIGWEIIALGPPLKLGGPPLPGIGVGAELRIYDGAVTGSDTKDPAKAKAVIVVDKMTGLNATARIAATRPDVPELIEGDLAVLARPADKFLRITVRLRPAREAGGIPKDRAALIRAAIAQDEETKLLVALTEDRGDFELSMGSDRRLQLRGPENRIRHTYSNDAAVSTNLWQHARQRALLQLQGEGGRDYTDNETLQVQLVPAVKQSPCADGVWEQAESNTEQIIPLCHAWNVQVSLSKNSPTPLLVGGVVLSIDGTIFGIPSDGRTALLKPGEALIFNAPDETYVGSPPLDVQDHVLVFGTQETNPVPWYLLTSTAAARAAGPPRTGLYRALDRYLRPGSRGVTLQEDTAEDTTWTMSSITMRVEANQRFLKPKTRDNPVTPREYTIKTFDIRPYLPDDSQTALYKVLQKADWLAKASVEDGTGYKQHGWNRSTDKENLKLGIDCSRALWFAFTRSGLPYNRTDHYLPTALMVGDDTWMKDEFASCKEDPNLQLGDILVYRDDTRGDGHAVMVIDPDKRIAWGSHGWDGNAKKLKVEPDTGVEYQLIKYKKNWQRWDRPTMEREACWRYRAFVREARKPGGQPSDKALASVCDYRRRCGT